MINEKDMKILSHLRSDARKKITEISRNINMPVTTIYDRLRSQHKKGIVKKHVTLVDFSKFGFNTSALVAFKVNTTNKEKLRKYLQEHPNINSLYKVNSEHNFLAEVVFKDIAKLYDFVDATNLQFNITDSKIFHVLSELKKEVFLTKPLAY